MNSIYDDHVLQDAMAKLGRAEQLSASEDMKLLCNALASIAFSVNELQKRIHFIEEKVGVSPFRAMNDLLGSRKRN